jgi:hypothetical protein
LVALKAVGLFDERNLFEFSDPKYPDERLIACRNPELAKLRAHKRQALLEATTLELDKIRDRVARGALEGAAVIGVKLGRVLDKYKVGKHFELTITDTAVKYQLLEPQVAAEAALDGISGECGPQFIDLRSCPAAHSMQSYIWDITLVMRKSQTARVSKTLAYDVVEQLRTPEEMAADLDAWFEGAPDDAAGIARALSDIARAQG